MAREALDLGQIVGAFTDRDGKTRGYRLTPAGLGVSSEESSVTRLSGAQREDRGLQPITVQVAQKPSRVASESFGQVSQRQTNNRPCVAGRDSVSETVMFSIPLVYTSSTVRVYIYSKFI